MNKRIFLLAVGVAAFLITGVISAYTLNFGTSLSFKKDEWGQFGDYFGGVLNPLFALLAFLSALLSIFFQQRAAQEAHAELTGQSRLARLEFESARQDRLAEELLLVIRDIDGRFERLLQTSVSNPGSVPLTIAHMAAEAERLEKFGGSSESLTSFKKSATAPGTLIEAAVREMTYLLTKLPEFLKSYSELKVTSVAPVIVYYGDKFYRLLPLFEFLEVIPDDLRKFYATISDQHG